MAFCWSGVSFMLDNSCRIVDASVYWLLSTSDLALSIKPWVCVLSAVAASAAGAGAMAGAAWIVLSAAGAGASVALAAGAVVAAGCSCLLQPLMIATVVAAVRIPNILDTFMIALLRFVVVSVYNPPTLSKSDSYRFQDWPNHRLPIVGLTNRHTLGNDARVTKLTPDQFAIVVREVELMLREAERGEFWRVVKMFADGRFNFSIKDFPLGVQTEFAGLGPKRQKEYASLVADINSLAGDVFNVQSIGRINFERKEYELLKLVSRPSSSLY